MQVSQTIASLLCQIPMFDICLDTYLLTANGQRRERQLERQPPSSGLAPRGSEQSELGQTEARDFIHAFYWGGRELDWKLNSQDLNWHSYVV